jgi:hypothetical protein
MNDQEFQDLMLGIKDLGKHRRGEPVPGVRLTEVPDPDVKAIREKTGLSQTRFAHLIGVKPNDHGARRPPRKMKPLFVCGSGLARDGRWHCAGGFRG